MRKEFARVTPESVGIPSASIEWLLDKLEEGWTETLYPATELPLLSRSSAARLRARFLQRT